MKKRMYLKERAGHSGHVIPHFGCTFLSPESLSPQLHAQTARYTQSVANLACDTVRCELTVAEESCGNLPIYDV